MAKGVRGDGGGGGGSVEGSSKSTHMDKGYPFDNKRGGGSSENEALYDATTATNRLLHHPIADEKETTTHSRRLHRDQQEEGLDRVEREREAALDLSYCLEVAATEPDISQLMEDLEATKSDEIKYRQAAAR